jgi:AIPR protein
VRAHSSDQLHDIVCDYSKRLEEGWNINLYFVSTGSASDRLKGLATTLDQSIKKKHPNVNFLLFDFYDLKERYVTSKSIDATISEFVDITFPKEYFILKEKPYRTILSVIKGNTLVNLYKKEKESLFAHNVRSFLGKRVNKDVVETAVKSPDDFYYFNNGVSAICTKIEKLAGNSYRFHHFQVINGAQTIGSLKAAGNLDPSCEVILRITEGASVKTEKGFNADIIRYNNTQNVVRASDFRANDKIQLWLEKRFNELKARGAIKFPLRYVRKRSFHRVREAEPLKLEELAKIRFAYFNEPTRCVADPRSLWTSSEDGGFYEVAFGASGELQDAWSDATFNETLFAVLVFFEIIDRFRKLIKQDRQKYFFLQRLRYWALSLAAIHLRSSRRSYAELIEAGSAFDKWFDEFWKDSFRELVAAYSRAQEDKISNFALARNETRWERIKQQVDLVWGAQVS